MRTTIDLDDNLIARAQEMTGLKSKSAVIRLALLTFIRLHEQSAIRALRGKAHWDGDLDEARRAR